MNDNDLMHDEKVIDIINAITNLQYENEKLNNIIYGLEEILEREIKIGEETFSYDYDSRIVCNTLKQVLCDLNKLKKEVIIMSNPLNKYSDKELNSYMIFLLLQEYSKEELIKIINNIDMDKMEINKFYRRGKEIYNCVAYIEQPCYELQNIKKNDKKEVVVKDSEYSKEFEEIDTLELSYLLLQENIKYRNCIKEINKYIKESGDLSVDCYYKFNELDECDDVRKIMEDFYDNINNYIIFYEFNVIFNV